MSINAIVGDNGILNQATNAADATDIADVKEQIQVALTNYYDDLGRYTEDDVLSAVQDVLGSSATINEADGVYTVQTAKGNIVDISDLIAGASETTVADSGSTEDDNDSGDSGSSEIDYDFSESTSLITVNDGDVNITDCTLEATYDSSSASTGTVAKLGGLESSAVLTQVENFEDVVCAVNGVYYSSLGNAIAACSDGCTITMLSDYLFEGNEIVFSDNLTIIVDLNSFTLLCSDPPSEVNGIEIDEGTVCFKNGAIYSTVIVNGGYVAIDNCTISFGYADVAITANAGTINLTSDDNVITACVGLYASGDATVNMTTGTVYGSSFSMCCSGGTVTINGGTFSSDSYVFYVTKGMVVINGGSYNGEVYAPVGCLVITSGYFSVDVSKWYAD